MAELTESRMEVKVYLHRLSGFHDMALLFYEICYCDVLLILLKKSFFKYVYTDRLLHFEPSSFVLSCL